MARMNWKKAEHDSFLASGPTFTSSSEIGVQAARDDVAVIEERAAARAAEALRKRREKAVSKKSSKTHMKRLAAWKAKRSTTS